MQEDVVQWDIRTMLCRTSVADQVLVFFLLAVLVVVGVKLFRVWKIVKPFSQRLPEKTAEYFNLLKLTTRSLIRWIQFSLLFGGFCIWIVAAKIVQRWFLNPKPGHIIGWCEFQQISGGVGLIMLVTTVTFLAQWYLEKRLQHQFKTFTD
jgi:hypothetical protein